MDKYPIESGVIRCICDLDHDDGFTIQCDSCEVWQHAECVDIEEDRVPKDYYCDLCQPRNFDKERAVKLQQRKIKDKGRRKYKVKRPDGRTRKTSKAPTQNSSAAPSPSASITARQPGRKKKKTKPEIESPDTTNQSPGASLIPDAEDLMVRICQGLLSSKSSGRKKNPASLGHSPSQAPSVLEYTLCPSHSTFEADPSDILVLDQDFMDHDLVEVEVRKIESLPRKKSVRNHEGLFTLTSMGAKQFIVEVTGKVILRSEYTQNSENLFSTVGTVMSDVVLHRSLNLAVDCREQPCIASHIRRHCKPNAELRSFFVAGVDTDVVHLGVFSTAPIAAGEEILLPWTLSAELLPDGLGNAVEEDLSKRLIAKAFHNAYNAIGRTLTQDQAKQVIQCLRQDSCPCLKEPLCIMNRFFRIRKLFWSRMKLPTLAGIENSTTTTVASQNMALEEKKPASGSETELDSSADVHLTCHPANELTPLGEHSSPQQVVMEAEPVLEAPQAPEAVQPESRPTPPPLVKSCHPSSPVGISKSPASPALPPLPAITPSCVVSRREQLQSMSLAKYFIAKYNSEHGLTSKEEKEVALRLTPPRSSATESEPVPHTSPPQATSSSTPQAAHENNQPAVTSFPATQLAAVSVSPDLVVAPAPRPPAVNNLPAPKKPSPVESPAPRPKSPMERHPARLTPRKGQRLSWKQFVIDPKSESQPPLSSSRPLNGHPSNGHSYGRPNGHSISFVASRRANAGPQNASRSPSPNLPRSRLKAASPAVHQSLVKNEDFPRRTPLSHLTAPNGRSGANPYSEAEEGELSNYSDSPLPDHPMGTRQFFAPNDRPHPSRHPSLDTKEESRPPERFHYSHNRYGSSNSYSFDRHPRDPERDHIRNRIGGRYIPPISPSGYRSEDRGPYHGHHRDMPHHRRERSWNVDSPLGYQSPATNPGTPHSELPPHLHHGPYNGGNHHSSQGYRSNNNGSHGSNFYSNSRGGPQSQQPSHHIAPPNPSTLPASRDLES